MNIEDIKSELAKLSPEDDAAWEEYKRQEMAAQPAKEKWLALRRRMEQLRAALEILEPKGEPEP